MNGEEAAIRAFVLDALDLAGASYSAPDEELVIAKVRLTKPGGFFAGPRVVEEDLQLVFTAEGAEKHPSAELVSPGSLRLGWFIEQARTRGFLTRQFYAGELEPKRLERAVRAQLPSFGAPVSLRLRDHYLAPFFLAVLRLTFTAWEKREELLCLVLNLVDGTWRPELVPRLRAAAFAPEAPPGPRRLRRRLAWKEIWRRLETKAGERIESLGAGWYRPALEALEREAAVLWEYYREAAAEAADPEAVRAEYARRAEELLAERAPLVRVLLANAALLYLPAVTFSVARADGQPFPPLVYEPAAEVLRWEGEPAIPFNPCRSPGDEPRTIARRSR